MLSNITAVETFCNQLHKQERNGAQRWDEKLIIAIHKCCLETSWIGLKR